MERITRQKFIEAALSLDVERLKQEDYQIVGQKMLASILKAANKPKTKSPERIENERMAKQIAQTLYERNTPVNAKWISDNVQGVLTSQKANAIMAVAIELGLCERIVLGKKPYYVHVDWNPEREEGED